MNLQLSRFGAVLLALVVATLLSFAVVTQSGDKTIPKVSSKQLAAEYVKNKAAASKKYGDSMNPKELIVEGVVAKLEDGRFGKIAKLEGSGKVVVSCLLRNEDVKSVEKGKTIAIKGKCRGYFEGDKLIDINGGVVMKAK